LEPVIVPERLNDNKEEGNRKPGNNSGFKQADRDIVRSQVDNDKFNGEQERYCRYTDFGQPCKPCPLVELDISHFRLFLCRYTVSRAAALIRIARRSSRTAACTARSRYRQRPRPENRS